MALYNPAASKGVGFTGKLTTPHGGAAPLASIVLSCKQYDNLVLKDTVDSTGQFKLNAEYVPPKNTDVKLVAEGVYNRGALSGTVSVEQILKQARYKLTASDALVFGLSMVAGQTEKGLGLDLGYNVKDKIFTKYDALAYLHTGDTRLALKHVSKPAASPSLGGLAVSVFQQVKPKLAVAGKATYDGSADQQFSWQAGFRYEMTPNRSLGGKIGSDKSYSFRSRQKLWEHVTLVYSIRRVKGNAHVEAGFKLKINL